MVTFAEVNTAIITGKLDIDLDALERAIRNRRLNIGYTLRRGDIVELKGLRPQYLNGHKAKVIKINSTTASIQLEQPAGHRFPAGYTIRCPLTCLSKV